MQTSSGEAVGTPSSNTSTGSIAPTSAEAKVDTPVAADGDEVFPAPKVPARDGGVRFWLIMTSLMIATFLSALELTSVSTALPTIVDHLHASWFANEVLKGGLAQIFGRRPVILGSLALFLLGSGLAGGSRDMHMLIGARTVQGIGSGGILSLTEIIIADLVPLRQRGFYIGLSASVWAIASAIGPPIGGAFSQSNWRWLFYLNVPLTAFAMVVVYICLRVKVPQDGLGTKLKRMDWIGNLIIVGATTASTIALTWAGIHYPWSSYKVLVPLIIGFVGMVVFFVYEGKFAKEPVVPLELLNNRTAISGYTSLFIHGVVSTTIFYYLPVYFQGSLLQSPVASGISIFGNAFTVAPAAILSGISISIFNIYTPQNVIGWILTIIGIGLLSLLKADSPKAMWIGFQVIEGLGIGILYNALEFPILASVKVTQNAHALALLVFTQSYSHIWAIVLGASILQNELKLNLPTEFLQSFGPTDGVEIAYAAIPTIGGLKEPLQTQVREAYADSLKVLWWALTGLSGLGFLTVFFLKELKMHEVTDGDWGLTEKEVPVHTEKVNIDP
ncbi:hypothetical protein FRB99_006728 [Tulasnella sp. 403]|nr:hypothetical protein FRB99_006728 [Tulasnella sp. 403]